MPSWVISRTVAVMPGVVFIAGTDGKLHALATADGSEVWSYDTTRSFDTVNKVEAKGGSIASIGPTIANGMLFIGSGYGVTSGNTGNVLLAFGIDLDAGLLALDESAAYANPSLAAALLGLAAHKSTGRVIQ